MTHTAVEGTQPKALLEAPQAGKKAPPAPMIVRVARAYGVSPFRQMRETLVLRFGANKLRPKDYYDFGLYDPSISMAQKREYVGVSGNAALNARLSPPDLIPTGAFVGNKVLYTALLHQMGLGTTQTQAIVSTRASFGTLTVLQDACALAEFLREEAAYPLFGKPRHGSLSAGSVRLDAIEGDILRLGNGKAVKLAAFCAEVMEKYPGGFLLQTALTPHPDMAQVTGEAMGCVRVVTVNDTGTPRSAYAVWKIPSPDAMSDNFWQTGAMLAALDLKTGAVTACRVGAGMDTLEITAHPVTGAQIVGTTLPHWEATKTLAAQAHALFPEFGVCGFDIAICADGPKVIECNDNPFHMLYQLATRRGIHNEELAPLWNAVAQRQAEKLARQKPGKQKKTGQDG